MEWFTEFPFDRTGTNDTESQMRLNEITIVEMVNKIHDIMLDNHRMKRQKRVKMVNVFNKSQINVFLIS